ncbi:serine hydrolase domain-containing protein [Streptomyces sp. NPDC020917]|uniref:serine hydrolase domain-containing protein n=1 Tax=Streptomyces sp. NPDC020917 TaxID=3365102 RepID=UPI0037AE38DD
MSQFDTVEEALAEIVSQGRCLGAALRVLHDGVEVLDLAVGDANATQVMATGTAVPWFSASKLAATVAVARAWELGLLHPSDRVVQHLPEFAGPGKDDIRIEHLLTHTAPLRAVDRETGRRFADGRHALLEFVLNGDADPDWTPGTRAAYLGHAGYLLLDEIVRRGSGRPFPDFLHQQVTAPLRLTSRLGGPPGVDVIDVPWFGPAELASRVARFDVSMGYPSACMAGPFGDAAEICEMLRQAGTRHGRRILSPETSAALVTDQRPPTLIDESAGRARRWGLGMVLAAENFGPASPASFGALGGTACLVFADPEAGVSVSLYFNGNTGVADRLSRDQRVIDALYRDLRQLGLQP